MRAALCFLAFSLTSLPSARADPRDRFVEDGTFLVASMELSQLVEPDGAKRVLEGLSAIEKLIGVGVLPPAVQRRQGVEFVATVARGAGVRRAFLAVAMDDLRIGYAPLVVCQLDEANYLEQLTLLLDSVKQLATEVVGDELWISTPKSLERYLELRSAERPDLLQPLVSLDHADPLLSVVIAPGNDSRRVVRELWPMLPKPLEMLTGPLIADGFERIELTARLEDTASLRLAVVARDEASRQRFAEFATAGLEQGATWIRTNQPQYADFATKSIEVLTPQAEGNTLSIELSTETPAVQELLAGVIAPAIQQTLERSRKASKMNQMKQLGLAMHNFHNVRGQFPASAAIIDENDRPLLSWRVALLPFIEQGNLHRQFHFDESWDSEHNLRVARQMPEAYANDSHPELTAKGKTTYQLPVYPGSELASQRDDAEPYEPRRDDKPVRFAPGDRFRDVTDGTSMTIMIAEVAPEHAVFWTKPEDWQVDLDDPMAKLRTDKRDGFVTAWYDAHSLFLSFDYSPSGLRKLITKAGGESLTEEERP